MLPADEPPDVPSELPGASASGRSPARPSAHRRPTGEAPIELNALLGRGTHYAGKLWFDGRVRIEGRFEGEIHGEDVLVVGEGAEVVASIDVGTCIVAGGSVRGNIRARDAIELHAPASVRGDLHAPNVFIDRGVQFEGSCTMAPLDPEPEGEPHPDAPPAPEPIAEHEPGES